MYVPMTFHGEESRNFIRALQTQKGREEPYGRRQEMISTSAH